MSITPVCDADILEAVALGGYQAVLRGSSVPKVLENDIAGQITIINVGRNFHRIFDKGQLIPKTTHTKALV